MTIARVRYSKEFSSRYSPGELLGEGGMGFVLRARDLRLDRPVAIKFLKTVEGVERFVREAKVTSALEHPNVIRIFDTGMCGELPYAVYELIEGDDLRKLLDAGKRFSPQEAIEIACQVLDALEAAHRAGVVHRDIKPSNVLLTAAGIAKVADFGIARVSSAPGLTQAGSFLGTPGYVAPEQMHGAEPDARSDVYATAAMLFELLESRPAFSGDDAAGILARQAAGPPDAPRVMPAGLFRVLSRALDPDPRARPESAAAFQAELLALGKPAPPSRPTVAVRMRRPAPATRPLQRATPPRSRWLLWAAAAALALGWAAAIRVSPEKAAVARKVTPRPAPPEFVVRPGKVVAFNIEIGAGPTTIRLRFHTNRPVRPRLVARAGSSPPIAPVTGPARLHHLLRLRGLSPGLRYDLDLGSVDSGIEILSGDERPLVAVTQARDRFERLMAKLRQAAPQPLGLEELVALLAESGESRVADLLLDGYLRHGRYGRAEVLRHVYDVAGPEHERQLLTLFRSGGPAWDANGLWRLATPVLADVGSVECARQLMGMAAGLDPVTGPALASELAVILSRLAVRHPEVGRELLDRASSTDEILRRVALTAVSLLPRVGWQHEVARLCEKAPAPELLVGLVATPELLQPLLLSRLRARDPAILTHLPLVPSGDFVPLLEALGSDAIGVLGRLGGDRAIRALSASGTGAAALALAEAGAVAQLGPIVDKASRGEDVSFWLAAAWLAGLKGADPAARARAAELFRNELVSDRPRLRAIAALGLGRSGKSSDVPLLDRVIQTEPWLVKLRALEGLLALSPERCRQHVLDLHVFEGEAPAGCRPQLDTLELMARTAGAYTTRLFIPLASPFLTLEPVVRAGEPLRVDALGPGWEQSALMVGAVTKPLVKRRGLALDDGPVRFVARDSMPLDGQGRGFFTVIRWR